jgi:hypothetical protein
VENPVDKAGLDVDILGSPGMSTYFGGESIQIKHDVIHKGVENMLMSSTSYYFPGSSQLSFFAYIPWGGRP